MAWFTGLGLAMYGIAISLVNSVGGTSSGLCGIRAELLSGEAGAVMKGAAVEVIVEF